MDFTVFFTPTLIFDFTSCKCSFDSDYDYDSVTSENQSLMVTSKNLLSNAIERTLFCKSHSVMAS